jgi:hypothetical protein
MVPLEELERGFKQFGIDSSQPAFYDLPAFQKVEQRNPRFLELYAQYVVQRHYTPEYLAHAKSVIERAARFVYDALVADGVIRYCEPVCMFLSRLLEKERIWNCAMKGSMTIRFSPKTGHGRRFFHHCTDPRKQQGVGHVWLIAPPFKIMDINLTRQGCPEAETRLLPPVFLTEEVEDGKLDLTELAEDEWIAFVESRLGGRITPENAGQLPQIDFLSRWGGVNEAPFDHGRLVYIPVGITAPDMPLEKMPNPRFSGRLPAQVYQDWLGAKEM